MIVFYIQHLDDTCRADVALCHSRIETVTSQVIQTIHVQLAADELVQKLLRIFIFEYLYGQIQLPFHLVVHTLHQHQ